MILMIGIWKRILFIMFSYSALRGAVDGLSYENSETFAMYCNKAGLTPALMLTLSGPYLWLGSYRGPVVMSIEGLARSAIAALGMPSSTPLCTEYMAVIVVRFVHPINFMLASLFMEPRLHLSRGYPLEESFNPVNQIERVSAGHFFGLLCEAYSDEEFSNLRVSIEKKMRIPVTDPLSVGVGR